MAQDNYPELNRIAEALPGAFGFYHLGEVRPEPAASFEPDDECAAVAYSLTGETRGLIVVLFDRGLDESTYAELGNILASRVAARLGEGHLISPPRVLTPQGLSRLLASNTPRLTRGYAHLHAGRSIPVQVMLLTLFNPEQAHA